MNIHGKQKRYQELIQKYQLETEDIKVNSQQKELAFQFKTFKKELDGEKIKKELMMIFDYANQVDIAITEKVYQDAEELWQAEEQKITGLLAEINTKITKVLLINTLSAKDHVFLIKASLSDSVDEDSWTIFKNCFSRSVKEAFGLATTLEITFTNHEKVSLETRADLQKRLSGINPHAVSEVKPEAANGKWGKKKEVLKKAQKPGDIIMGKAIKKDSILLSQVDFTPGGQSEGETLSLWGWIFGVYSRELKNNKTLLTFNLTDNTGSITAKIFTDQAAIVETVKEGTWIRLEGRLNYDDFNQELTLVPRNMVLSKEPIKADQAPVKRVELHLHSQFSAMDAVSKVEKIMKQAKNFGHDSIGITDHGVLQAYPEMMRLGEKYGIKVLYGLEGYLVEDQLHVVTGTKDQDFDQEFIFFDLETTGLIPGNHQIIEIAGVRIRNKQIIDHFHRLINPHCPIPPKIVELTGITSQMVEEGVEEDQALNAFFDFCGEAILVAHNAPFDMGFMQKAMSQYGFKKEITCIDSLALARCLLSQISRHNLKKLCSYFKIDMGDHHRALDDAMASAKVFLKLLDQAEKKDCDRVQALNNLSSRDRSIKMNRPNHIIIYAKNQAGIKDLYRLVSESHLHYFYRKPRIPKSLLAKNRHNFLLGSACEAGELFSALLNQRPREEIIRLAKFYDFLEIQPLGNNQFLIDNHALPDLEALKEINRQIIKLGAELGKMVVATGDVHFVDKEDALYREILFTGQGYKDASQQAPLYYRNTADMLAEFAYLGDDLSYQVVVENTRQLATMIEAVTPIPQGTFPPIMEGSDEAVRQMAEDRAHVLFGKPLPDLVASRMTRELDSIIGNGYSVLYLIAHKLVAHSMEDGYLVGSRGSVGSSFVATLCGITEVNPLAPHYRCPTCQYSAFFNSNEVGVGPDLKDAKCPNCQTPLIKDGFDIPFETFLGFEGDKEPDIDLNFSGDNQAEAHRYTEELFGKGKVFRAGTISTIADKTAFGFVKNFFDEQDKTIPRAEIDRVVACCAGVKKTTGQHPGGIMVVPDNKDIYDFCPVQRPADDVTSETVTTHFDYESIAGRLLKLDILGHDDPTMLKMLNDFTGVDPVKIPLDEAKTMSLFRSTEALDLVDEDFNSPLGVCGIPEFGTSFVRDMLMDTKPTDFSDLIRISGLSHGSDVWVNNAQDLIREKKATIKEVICTRDDIMIDLIYRGLDAKMAFNIMEAVRKGKGLQAEWEEAMQASKVPRWYIDSCKKIKYMFPKAHAAAYVTMAFRIAWYKVYYPLAYYATYFTVRADEFDAQYICQGKEALVEKIKAIQGQGVKASNKEKALLTILEVAYEMICRGYSFMNIDLYRSHFKNFAILGDQLLPPLNALEGIGEKAARRIFDQASKRPYISREDLQQRTRISKANIETLSRQGCLKQLPASNQVSFL